MNTTFDPYRCASLEWIEALFCRVAKNALLSVVTEDVE